MGPAKLKKAIVSGNYFKPRGLGYGGQRLTRSAENLISIAREFKIPDASVSEEVVLIDVHTGLGPSGTDTLMIMPGNDAIVTDRIFPTELDARGQAVGGLRETIAGKGEGSKKSSSKSSSAAEGYELTVGFVAGHFCREFLAPHLMDNEGKRMICVTQEFGTVPMMQVGKAQVDENYAWHHGSDEEKATYGKRLKGVFYVETDAWKRSVARRGLAVFVQGLKSFGL